MKSSRLRRLPLATGSLALALMAAGTWLMAEAPTLVPAVATSQSGAPPRETNHRLGTDAKGVDWQVRVAVGEPLSVFGVQRYRVATREPFDLFEIHAVIDSSDVAWIVDGRGRGVRVRLADGKADEFRVPVSMQLVGGIAVRQGRLYFGENPSSGNRSIRQMDIASGAVRTLLSLEAEWSVYTLVSGRRNLWVVNWTGLATPADTIELVALDWASGVVSTRGRRSMPRAAYAQSRFEAIEADDGAAWVANGYTGRIERLDASGMWQGWPLDGRTPTNLVAAGFGAACVVHRLKPPTDTRQLEGMPFERPAVLSREIAAFLPGSDRILTVPLDAGLRLVRDGDGGVRVEGRGRLSIESGRLQIVPGAQAAR